LGGCIALVVFSVVWILMPGGKTELLALISDLRSARRRKAVGIPDPEPAAVAD
jgi:hypothetical protein